MATLEHPSNLLYRGEATSFADAMRLLAAACQFENRLWQDPDCDLAGLRNSIDGLRAAAARCVEEHAAAVRNAELALAEQWAADPDGFVRQIAEAVRSGDYSDLAF